ncbi:MAG TPA: arginine--tRNA ligase [Acidimicrobiia bacterium]|nr:arginine--tRNA ligase [Acidimicrobiia bacterium]
MSVVSHLSQVLGAAFADLGLDPALGTVVPSNRPELAQFQCNGAMAAAKATDRSPREIAEAVVASIEDDPTLEVVEVAGPGFINLSLTDTALADWTETTADDPRLGVATAAEPATVVVDYAGPNVAKAMHVGHLRATIIGDSLARLFDFLGHKVIRDPHFGDWGLQMGLVIAELQLRHPEWPYFDPDDTGPYPDTSPVTLDDLQEIYPAADARAKEDADFAAAARQATVALQAKRPGYLALWNHMRAVSLEAQKENFAGLGVDFDIWHGESDVAHLLAPLVERLRQSGKAEESEGALVVRIDEPDDKRDLPPLILVSRTGGYLYSTTDLATVWYRAEQLGADLALYVVDSRQGDHFIQVFRAARKCGVANSMQMEHIGFGTMNGRDGKPFRTREGGVVSLSDLIDMVEDAAMARLDEAQIATDYPPEERKQIAHLVGVAALKFGDLHSNRTSDYVFDLERFSSFEGKTGPYLQYAAVRIRSLLRKADEQGLESSSIIAPVVNQERALMLELLRLPEVALRAADQRSPHHLAEYAYGLAGAFNRFYDACHVLSQPDETRRGSWLSLCRLTLETLIQALDLLGIEVPERM